MQNLEKITKGLIRNPEKRTLFLISINIYGLGRVNRGTRKYVFR